jgi:hypothetical protein
MRNKTLRAQLALLPFALIILLIVWLLTSCSGSKYLTDSNFYKLSKGMTESEFLEWIKPNRIAVNGAPSSVKMFSFRGDEWKVYCFDLYSVNGSYASFNHREYAAFRNGRLEEYGEGSLPLTLRQNPSTYTIISR